MSEVRSRPRIPARDTECTSTFAPFFFLRFPSPLSLPSCHGPPLKVAAGVSADVFSRSRGCIADASVGSKKTAPASRRNGATPRGSPFRISSTQLCDTLSFSFADGPGTVWHGWETFRRQRKRETERKRERKRERPGSF